MTIEGIRDVSFVADDATRLKVNLSSVRMRSQKMALVGLSKSSSCRRTNLLGWILI